MDEKQKIAQELFKDDPAILHKLEFKALNDKINAIPIPKNGEDGYTPIKGVDYFDGEDGYTPQKGIDYFDGEKGEDGKTPTVTELTNLIQPLIPTPLKGQNGKDADPIDEEEVIDSVIEKIKKEKSLDISHIKNAASFMKDGIRYKIEELMHGSGNGSGQSVLLQVNGVNNTVQSILNLTTGSGISLFDDGMGGVDFNVVGSISGGGTGGVIPVWTDTEILGDSGITFDNTQYVFPKPVVMQDILRVAVTGPALLQADDIGTVIPAVDGTDYWSPTSLPNPAVQSYVTIENAELNSNITPVADGTYTLGLGLTTNGTITTVSGIITNIQEVS